MDLQASAKSLVDPILLFLCVVPAYDVSVRIARHFPLVLGVYLLGYFRMSVAWLVGLVGFTAARHQWKKEHDFRMQAARASVLSDEKEVITARVSDLPSWVRSRQQ